ncbi:uncharacterized protein LOC124643223 [Helicoverpa zea]|uniref:uncharacterized protein LOC124643223 n=1 Tax=Helicoverpa zea TaxID=7113 RepID=UPI001F591D1B|nr:uncharacterized protein LOC124643223 [Helicoverpa zea]
MAASASNFVHVVQQYPCLYNNKLPEYLRKDVTDKAWSEVAQKTNTSVADCQTRWRNIRNGFVRSLKPNTKQKKLYYLHEELQFVVPFVKAIINTGDAGNMQTSAEVDTENNESNSLTDDEEIQFALPCVETIQTNEFADTVVKTEVDENTEFNTTDDVPEYGNTSLNTPFSVVEPYVRKRKIRKVTNEVDKAYEEWMRQKELKSDRARKMFLLSLVPDVESLTEEQMRKFRIKVLLLLEDIQAQ